MILNMAVGSAVKAEGAELSDLYRNKRPGARLNRPWEKILILILNVVTISTVAHLTENHPSR